MSLQFTDANKTLKTWFLEKKSANGLTDQESYLVFQENQAWYYYFIEAAQRCWSWLFESYEKIRKIFWYFTLKFTVIQYKFINITPF